MVCAYSTSFSNNTQLFYFLLINNGERKSPSTAGSNLAEMNCKHEDEVMDLHISLCPDRKMFRAQELCLKVEVAVLGSRP